MIDSYYNTLSWRKEIPLDEDTESERANTPSFLQSPQALWEESPVEEILTVVGNAASFYFYGRGTSSEAQDLSSKMAVDRDEIFTEACPGTLSEGDGHEQRSFACSEHCIYCKTFSPNNQSLYESLPSAEHIRLLELLPGSGPIECKLHVAALPDDQNTYEAVSYTWDLNYCEWSAGTDEIPLRCNGIEVAVKENLYAALGRLRRPNQSRILWVDSLCICQTDSKDRSHQVARMGIIFESAYKVLVWLGNIDAKQRPPANPPRWWNESMSDPIITSTLAQETFSGICQLVNEWRANSNQSNSVAEAIFSTNGIANPAKCTPKPLMADSPLWRKIFHLFRGRWFHRLWVVQEVAVARSLTVLWDDCEISWEILGIAAAIIRNNFQKISSTVRKKRLGRFHSQPPDRRVPPGVLNAYFMYRLSRAQKFSEAPRFTFLQLLRLTRHFGCKDERDRIYGLLALPTIDRVQGYITPDYSKSTAEVYEQLCRCVITSSQSLSILTSVGRGSGVPYHGMMDERGWTLKTEQGTESAYIPSWVPQWQYIQSSSISPPEPHPSFDASLRRPAQLQETDDPRKFIVRGIFVDDVKTLIPEGSYWRGEPSAAATLGRQQRGYGLRRKHVPLEQTLEIQSLTLAHLHDISTTLTTGKDWFGIPITDSSVHLADYARCLLKEGLRWSANRKFAQRFQGFGVETAGDIPTAPDETSADVIDVHILHELSQGGNADRFLDSAAAACHGRVVFETQMGMVGVGPQNLEPGDKVCILYGVDLPFILRHEGNEGYSVLGSCYIQPLMKGEAAHELSRSGSSLEETWIELV